MRARIDQYPAGKHLNLVADSFSWPFRGRWRSRWAIGIVTVLLLPVLFIPLLGYAVEATRAAAESAAGGPPRWRLNGGLLADGLWLALAILLVTAPFALAALPLSSALSSPALWRSSGSLLEVEGAVTAALIVALPWGITILLLMPHATARFAATRRPADLFDFPTAVRGVGRDFAIWNVVVAAIVTGWAAGLACVGLLGAGVVPGIFYAILVSAHATAALYATSENSSAR